MIPTHYLKQGNFLPMSTLVTLGRVHAVDIPANTPGLDRPVSGIKREKMEKNRQCTQKSNDKQPLYNSVYN